MITRLALLLCIALLTGCATNFVNQYYRDMTGGATEAQLSQGLMPFSGTTAIYSSNDLAKDGPELQRRGYEWIGWSGFELSAVRAEVTDAQIKEQAKAVKADVALYKVENLGSEQSTYQQLNYIPGQTSMTQSSGTANASVYGTGGAAYGTANYSGTSMTMAPGTFSVSQVPVTLHRSGHEVVFFRKGKPSIFGAKTAKLTEELRVKLKRNTGALVTLVLYDTPAFRANAFPGDIIVALNDTPVHSDEDYYQKLVTLGGTECKFTVLREGVETMLTAKLNPAPL